MGDGRGATSWQRVWRELGVAANGKRCSPPKAEDDDTSQKRRPEILPNRGHTNLSVWSWCQRRLLSLSINSGDFAEDNIATTRTYAHAHEDRTPTGQLLARNPGRIAWHTEQTRQTHGNPESAEQDAKAHRRAACFSGEVGAESRTLRGGRPQYSQALAVLLFFYLLASILVPVRGVPPHLRACPPTRRQGFASLQDLGFSDAFIRDVSLSNRRQELLMFSAGGHPQLHS